MPASASSEQRKLAAILAADVASYSALATTGSIFGMTHWKIL